MAFIDWQTAGPTDRFDEVAATAWWNAQLHDDDIADRQQLPVAAERATQLRHFLDGYGIPTPGRIGIVTRMIEYAIRDAAAEAIKSGVTPESGNSEALWATAWRARAAAWMLRHRPMLESAVSKA